MALVTGWTKLANSKPQPTLRKRLVIFLVLPMTALLVISLAIYYRIAFNPADEAYDHAIADDVVALGQRVRLGSKGLEVDLPAAAEAVLRSDSTDQEFFAIYGPEGNLLSGDADLKPDAASPDHPPVFTNSRIHGMKVRKASYSIQLPNGIVTIAVAETTRKRESTGAKILAAMITPNVLLILATLALVNVGVRSGLAPLTRLGGEISRRSPHDLSPLPKEVVPGEAAPLVNAISTLIDDLRVAAQGQQAFLANAAHQLKTPLAGLQTQLELAVAELPESHRQRMVNLRDATFRLGHLAHQLLALARSGTDADISHERRTVALAELARENASTWFDQALNKDIDLGFELEAATTEGSQWLLRELMANLVDNALQYTPASGQVTVRTGTSQEGNPFFEIEDNGPGIPVDERQRIFDRFYRASGTLGAGTGLGLAIVKEVADRHAAEICIADNLPAGGTRIRISFPDHSSANTCQRDDRYLPVPSPNGH